MCRSGPHSGPPDAPAAVDVAVPAHRTAAARRRGRRTWRPWYAVRGALTPPQGAPRQASPDQLHVPVTAKTCSRGVTARGRSCVCVPGVYLSAIVAQPRMETVPIRLIVTLAPHHCSATEPQSPCSHDEYTYIRNGTAKGTLPLSLKRERARGRARDSKDTSLKSIVEYK